MDKLISLSSCACLSLHLRLLSCVAVLSLRSRGCLRRRRWFVFVTELLYVVVARCSANPFIHRLPTRVLLHSAALYLQHQIFPPFSVHFHFWSLFANFHTCTHWLNERTNDDEELRGNATAPGHNGDANCMLYQLGM